LRIDLERRLVRRLSRFQRIDRHQGLSQEDVADDQLVVERDGQAERGMLCPPV
jgi:hypothetical protein